MRIPVTLALLVALSGCADSHQWSPLQNGSARIAKTDKIYISTPADGEYGDHVYRGSGRNTSSIISSAVSKRSRWMRVGAVADNFQDALAQAQSMGQDVLIYPTILHWGVSRTLASASDAVSKMGVGLPESACRSWLQTARCCCVQKA
ncbi:DUF4823 domain-containing protein, partial [Pseudomonas syringae]|uniref:DUF4823 domain-containing protein n=1 Tax=Pseudomonas syringae TaxID=317 RepID=UPI002FD8A33D